MEKKKFKSFLARVELDHGAAEDTPIFDEGNSKRLYFTTMVPNIPR